MADKAARRRAIKAASEIVRAGGSPFTRRAPNRLRCKACGLEFRAGSNFVLWTYHPDLERAGHHPDDGPYHHDCAPSEEKAA